MNKARRIKAHTLTIAIKRFQETVHFYRKAKVWSFQQKHLQSGAGNLKREHSSYAALDQSEHS